MISYRIFRRHVTYLTKRTWECRREQVEKSGSEATQRPPGVGAEYGGILSEQLI